MRITCPPTPPPARSRQLITSAASRPLDTVLLAS
ncbi:hypothetical protein E2C01_088924 [Portunus trituberculatus]|uniref:Uncharacterized protein n=1 Tax=Portunus trituberculatus TaxID=210409 RepID=A0A5B7JHD1_PORTR|nr:hypothetical protein [Portunus trituberculatus]